MLKSNLSSAGFHSGGIGQSVGDLAALPSVGCAGNDNTPVLESCCSVYEKGRTLLSGYLKSASQDSANIKAIGIHLEDVDKTVAKKVKEKF